VTFTLSFPRTSLGKVRKASLRGGSDYFETRVAEKELKRAF
jgi:hypothetical protein